MKRSILLSLIIPCLTGIAACRPPAPEQITVSVTTVGSGTVSRSVDGIPDDGPYDVGTSVWIKPSASGADIFGYWSGDLGYRSDPAVLTVTFDMDIVAHFGTACAACGGSAEEDCTACGGSLTEACAPCGGSGSSMETCGSCGGSGMIIFPPPMGPMMCFACAGTGHMLGGCPDCGGDGLVACSTCRGDGQAPCSTCGGKAIQE